MRPGRRRGVGRLCFATWFGAIVQLTCTTRGPDRAGLFRHMRRKSALPCHGKAMGTVLWRTICYSLSRFVGYGSKIYYIESGQKGAASLGRHLVTARVGLSLSMALVVRK
jgi:hypothetical protein